MPNFQQDWGAMDSLLNDTGDASNADAIPPDAKRRVQLLCVAKADYDREQAEEFMHMLGIHPADPQPVERGDGPPLPSPHLQLTQQGRS